MKTVRTRRLLRQRSRPLIIAAVVAVTGLAGVEALRQSRAATVKPTEQAAVQAQAIVPNDPRYGEQSEWKEMGVDQVWATTTGSANVTIALLDGGILATHEEFSGRIVNGYDFVNKDAIPNDEDGYGTRLAGMLAAAGNNGIGIAGGCWKCKLMPLKIYDSKGLMTYDGVRAEAIRYAVDKGAKVIVTNATWPNAAAADESAIQYAESKNVLVIGNNATSAQPAYPSIYPLVLTQMGYSIGSRQVDNTASLANLDVVAPIDQSLTTDFTANGSYVVQGGQAFAGARVGAVAALLFSAYPQATAADVRQAITSTADACCTNRKTPGSVNAPKALVYLASKYSGNPNPTPPNPTPGSKSGDLNGDGKVNLTDLSLLLSNWGKSGTGDINKDGKVNLTDLSLLLSNWGK